ncbi:MAG: hypothetical protein HOW73_39265 [Polyangiaceae bacterium]|nr:hypothetical protein [Polyangiaceae bacterium]
MKRANLISLALALGAGCGNPIADDQIEFWGDELPNVPASEHHRPGQPCVLCHGVYGGAAPEMVLGGTIFADQYSFTPVEGAEVVVYDAVGDVYTMTSNCIGNFFMEKEGNLPQFPLAVEVRCPTYDSAGNKLESTKIRSMNSWISRDGSCATCHSLRGTQVDSTGWIFCNDPTEIQSNPYPAVPSSCPGEPPKEAQ